MRPGPDSLQSRLLRSRVEFALGLMHGCLRQLDTTASFPYERRVDLDFTSHESHTPDNYDTRRAFKDDYYAAKNHLREDDDSDGECPGGSQALDFSIMQEMYTATVSYHIERTNALRS